MDGEADTGSPVATIGRKAGRGLRWSLVGTLVTKAGSFVMGLVLARLLAPEDFGLYAIALAATAFVMHVNDVGIIAATVQWRGRLEEMAPTATVMAVGFSVAVYGIFWFAAPGFAALAGGEDATPVVRLLTVVILIDGLTAVRSAALMREFRHDLLTMANMAGFCVNAGVAITLAANGAGPYSFAWGQLAAAAVTGVLVLAGARVPVRVGLDRAVAGRLLRFGVPLAASLGIESVLLNADYIIVGGALGTVALGYYLLAFNVSSWVPGLVGTAVRYVSIPSFSRLAEEESDSVAEGVRRSVPPLVALVLPIAVAMAALAGPFVALYGAKWAPAAAVLPWLAVLMVVRMLTALACDILISLGATRATVWLNLGWALALVPALLVGTRVDGIRGAAVGHALVAVLVALPLAAAALHRAGVPLGPVLPGLVRPLLGGVVAAAVMLPLGVLVAGPALVTLCVAGGAGVLAYAVVVVPRQTLARLAGESARLVRPAGRKDT
ncbi:hypothetical protein Misp01_39300 [Microtetraspora sp. NBRC 13810]|uniref:lipopolysaccharide biosynthesis protein n=1 Tax=Microtetraspora sp. NBRC 13810 TaxID=3030990 RepID=UPI0025523EED|nr:lipopolysaccharide biosynthesis protein [Microtetraspora sp. NBRC 13810]GLW08800.1 hypothetical protein Misp01_39300 [Microtetraspora sp. NBRC 13810]